jgi:hypothetical protein
MGRTAEDVFTCLNPLCQKRIVYEPQHIGGDVPEFPHRNAGTVMCYHCGKFHFVAVADPCIIPFEADDHDAAHPFEPFVVDANLLDHLLNCMCNQKYIHEQRLTTRIEWQKTIDTAYHEMRMFLVNGRKKNSPTPSSESTVMSTALLNADLMEAPPARSIVSIRKNDGGETVVGYAQPFTFYDLSAIDLTDVVAAANSVQGRSPLSYADDFIDALQIIALGVDPDSKKKLSVNQMRAIAEEALQMAGIAVFQAPLEPKPRKSLHLQAAHPEGEQP